MSAKDKWEYKGYEIVFTSHNELYIEDEEITELWGSVYTRDKVRHYIDEHFEEKRVTDEKLSEYL